MKYIKEKTLGPSEDRSSEILKELRKKLRNILIENQKKKDPEQFHLALSQLNEIPQEDLTLEIFALSIDNAVILNDQNALDQLLLKSNNPKSALFYALTSAFYEKSENMFVHVLEKVSDQKQLGRTLDWLAFNCEGNQKMQQKMQQILQRITDPNALLHIINNDLNSAKSYQLVLESIYKKNPEMLNEIIPKITKIDALTKLHFEDKKSSDLIEKRIYALEHPWLAHATDSLKNAANWIGLGGTKNDQPLLSVVGKEVVLSSSSGALPSSNPTDKPAPAQAAGPSWQNIGAQVALAAVAGALVYGAGKAAYNLYKRNTGPNATTEDINKATALLKKVAKFDPKELSKISQEFKTHADQITDRLNDLYDARKSNSDEYKNLREQLDKVTANQDAISTLQNSMKAMKSEAKHFVAPKYALKEGYVGGIINECANIQDICEKLGVSMAKSPKSHAQKVMAEREGKSAGDKAL